MIPGATGKRPWQSPGGRSRRPETIGRDNGIRIGHAGPGGPHGPGRGQDDRVLNRKVDGAMLKGQDIALAAIQKDDQELLYQWLNDPDLMRWLTPYRPIDPASFANWFNNIGRDGTILFGIRYLPENKLIGTLHFTTINNVHRTGEIALKIGNTEYRGKGYGHAALTLAVQFAWDDLNLQRVALTVYHDNEPAIQAYKAAGFELEGRMRRAVHVKGAWKDLLVMSILRPEAR